MYHYHWSLEFPLSSTLKKSTEPLTLVVCWCVFCFFLRGGGCGGAGGGGSTSNHIKNKNKKKSPAHFLFLLEKRKETSLFFLFFWFDRWFVISTHNRTVLNLDVILEGHTRDFSWLRSS